jgi:peptidoglycan hydrolase CwlO-like protein
MQSQETQSALVAQSIKHIEKSLADIFLQIEKMQENLVIRSEFDKLEKKVELVESALERYHGEISAMKNDVDLNKKVIYGTIGIILTTVVTALTYLVVNMP